MQANQLAEGIELRLDLIDPISDEEKAELCKKTHLPLILNSGEPIVSIRSGTENQTLCSYHHFEETPKDLSTLLASMMQRKTDVYKIATLAHSTLDALRMLKFVKEKTAEGIKICGICMGERGQISRILAPVFGSAINYAVIDQPCAPGQLKLKELSEIYHYYALNQDTAVYGLIGDPIVQSPSQMTHNAFFRKQGLNAVYVKMQLTKEELPAFFPLAKELGIRGLSVTIPLKEAVIPFLDEIDPLAMEIGAVNTILFENGKLKGFNTDASGALDAIEAKLPVQDKKIVLLGAGGSAKAIAFEAKRRGALVTLLARRPEHAQSIRDVDLKKFEEVEAVFKDGYDILINCTPEMSPVDPRFILEKTVIMDINTKHRDTPLLLEAQNKGCTIVYGYEMFMNQAIGQFKLWFRDLQNYELDRTFFEN